MPSDKGEILMLKHVLELPSALFIGLVSLYFSFGLNNTFWLFVFQHYEISGVSGMVFWLSLPFFIFVPLYCFFNLVMLPYVGKAVIVCLLFLSGMADYAMSTLGQYINSGFMRNVAETNTREALDLITPRAIIFLLVWSVLPAVWVMLVRVSYSPLRQEVKNRLWHCAGVLVCGVLLVGSVYKEYVSFGRNHKEFMHNINTLNYISAFVKYYKSAQAENHPFVVLDATPHHEAAEQPRVLVLIVGETARAQNFSLYGYERETNPRLAKQDVAVFGDVSSCGTATAISLPCMFAWAERKSFDVSAVKYTQNVLDIVKLAGYSVFWKDNDDGCKGVCDRVENADAKVGNKQPYCFGNYCQDEILLDGLEKRLAQITSDSVIVLHTMGSHGPMYYKRYPERFKKFLPECATRDIQRCSKEEIVNTYDNTILYTDFVVSEMIEKLKAYPQYASAMIYISDHGESLGEGNLYLHGVPYAVAPDVQKKIPFLFWANEPMKAKLGLDWERFKTQAAGREASHDNLFSSVLGVLDVQSSAYQPALDVFSRQD